MLWAYGRKYGSIRSSPKRSFPASTGVCVVKQAASAHEFPRFGEGEPPLLHEQADTLKDEERGMPLVHMIHGGPDAEARMSWTPPMPSRIS